MAGQTGAPAPKNENVVQLAPKPMGFFDQLFSYNRVFWIANLMEMLERLAYYGLRVVLPIYLLLSLAKGGPEFNHEQKGLMYFWWANVQSFLPIVTGGYSDRYGYKLTVGVSIAIKVAGYLIMGFATDIAAALSGGASLETPGHIATLSVFMTGALLLAAGTATFKPGLQGMIAANVKEENSSLAWSLFYQLVNLGAFLGPPLAGVLQLMSWKLVFISCAGIVSLNYFALLMFEEPAKAHWPDGKRPVGTLGEEIKGFGKVLWDSVLGILEPRLAGFLILFSGFWAMFYQLFDLLPNFITDWVDSTDVYNAVAVPIFGLFGSTPPAEWGGMVPQEQLINLNAGMIVLFAFAFGYLTGKIRSMTAMMIGMAISAVGVYFLGAAATGFGILLAVVIFSTGEMLASPTKMRYFGGLAPEGKKGLYLGYVNATVGIGWGLGSLVAGEMYQNDGDKVVLARRYLVDEVGQSADAVAAMPKDDVIPALSEATSQTAMQVQHMLYDFYDPSAIWLFFVKVGLMSMVGLIAFDVITRLKLSFEKESAAIIGLSFVIAGATYGWDVGFYFAAAMSVYVYLRNKAPHLLPD